MSYASRTLSHVPCVLDVTPPLQLLYLSSAEQENARNLTADQFR